MLYNYLKIAFRSLRRHKGFSLINIAGLAIGMACSILILLWVRDELSYDRFHTDVHRLYRLTASLSEMDVHAAVTPAPLPEALQAQVPVVEQTVRLNGLRKELMQVGDKMFEEERIFFADSTFLRMFSFKLVAGDPADAFKNPESILITESMARKYFGNEEPLGKTIRQNHKDDFTVAGVLADVPSNSHLQFDFVIPMSFLARTDRDLKERVWDNFNFYNYIKLNDKADTSPEGLAKLEAQITTLYRTNEKELKVDFHLQPVKDIHLRSSFLADLPGHGNIQYVYIFIVVAVFILVVACINFMNLATARSARRAKEVGLRKVAGAMRAQLIRQFLAESSLISVVSLILAVLIVFVSLPGFNTLAGKQLSIDLLNVKLVAGLLGITFLTGLLAGSYPALFLSSFMPATVLKGNLKTGAASSFFRNTMVVLQFSVSIILLVGTAAVYKQLKFIQSRNLGYDKENLVYVPMTGDLWSKYQTLRTSLEQEPLTQHYTVVQDLPTNVVNGTVSVEWEGKDKSSQPLFCNMAIDENFLDVFKVTLLDGRGFSKEAKADTSNYLVNESALRTMGMDVETAVGKPLTLWGNKGVIIGVVKNFNFKPIQQPIEPLILRLNTWGGAAVVRTAPGETENTIKALERICQTLNPEYPFSYKFIDQDLDNMYRAEQRLGGLFNIFAVLAIFISCLGLYGLSAFLAERRTKELGVRKVLGASLSHLVYLLLSTFTKPVLIAMLVAAPIGWYAMTRWLEGFAFHISLDWTIFAFAFVVALFIAWFTVSYESIKAALTNPAKSLKDE
ncbi:ABC transporter permease [Dawidia soli]|uniref:ABC transporter permease n=1 Tax=Dawidia soli TaxID=2782352 RepID=A0AAP2GJK0_9BACT|nr:ABC transporter permease [Dawidia soli]MBT1688565.1 ABC transporter permease [Dawidia soli]